MKVPCKEKKEWRESRKVSWGRHPCTLEERGQVWDVSNNGSDSAKFKVRPMLDFRELNTYEASHMESNGMDVCGETMWEWRQMVGADTIVDLKSAYCQLYVAEKLYQYELVRNKRNTYYFTRLSFGVNVAPKTMAAVLKTILSRARKNRESHNFVHW